MSGKVVGWAMEQVTGSPITKSVLVKLADNANEEGLCYPSIALIVRHTELSERAVRDHLAKLESLGLIRIERRVVQGAQLPNIYHLNIRGVPSTGGVQDVQGGCSTRTTPVHEVQAGAAGHAGGGVQEVHPNINRQVKPSDEPSLNRRVRAASPQDDGSPPSTTGDEFAPVWFAICEAWGELPSTATEERTRKAWLRVSERLPERDELIACIRAFGRKIAAENAARGAGLGRMMLPYPHNWLARDDGWKPFLLEIRNAPQRAAEAEERGRRALSGLTTELQAALRAAGLTQVELETWFVGVTFEPPGRFIFPKEFARHHATQKFGARIARAWKREIELAVATAQTARGNAA